MVKPKRFDVFLVSLDPAVGSGIKKARPCVVVSPDEMNRYIRTIIIAPLIIKGGAYPTRIALSFRGRAGEVILDQIRTVDKKRLVEKLGALSEATARTISQRMVELFAY